MQLANLATLCVGAGLTGVGCDFRARKRRVRGRRYSPSCDRRALRWEESIAALKTRKCGNFNGTRDSWAGKCCFRSPTFCCLRSWFSLTCYLSSPSSLPSLFLPHLPFDPRSFRAVVSPALWFPTFICCSHSPSLSPPCPIAVPRRVLSPAFFLFLRGLTHSLDQVNVNLALAATSCTTPESVAQAPASRALLASNPRDPVADPIITAGPGTATATPRGSIASFGTICSRHSAGIYQSRTSKVRSFATSLLENLSIPKRASKYS